MTPVTKDTRRADWQRLNFAGSIDWAVDLQAFGQDDMSVPADPPPAGEQGCVAGESPDLNADSLCRFSCNFGFCPEPICECTLMGPVRELPRVVATSEFVAWDEFDMELQRLCKFACKYGFCPQSTCGALVVDEWDDGSVDSTQSGGSGGLWDKEKNYNENRWQCQIFKAGDKRDDSVQQCYQVCASIVEEAIAEGRTTNYGCVGFWPLDSPIPWVKYPGSGDPGIMYAMGKCACDNMLINTVTDMVIDALPIIAQVCCSML